MATACVVACAGPPAGAALAAITPAQRVVYGWLMPGFDVVRFGVAARPPHLLLDATARTREYLVVGGRAHAPGLLFAAETPARAALVHAALVAAGSALVVAGSRRAIVAATTVVLLAGTLMALVAPAIVLAGAQWNVVLMSWAEPSLPALLAAASAALLHGGAYALVAAAVGMAALASRAATRRGPARQDPPLVHRSGG